MNGKKIAVLVFGVVAILAVCFGLFKIMTKDNSELDNPNIETESGEQLSGEQIVEEFVIGEREAIFTEETYPRIDGSTATIKVVFFTERNNLIASSVSTIRSGEHLSKSSTITTRLSIEETSFSIF